MTITPDQARELLDDLDQTGTVPTAATEAIAALDAVVLDLAQTIAGMTEEWGVERDRPGTAYIDGTVARTITWVGDEARARKACVISPRGGNPRLVRRLVGPVEEAE